MRFHNPFFFKGIETSQKQEGTHVYSLVTSNIPFTEAYDSYKEKEITKEKGDKGMTIKSRSFHHKDFYTNFFMMEKKAQFLFILLKAIFSLKNTFSQNVSYYKTREQTSLNYIQLSMHLKHYSTNLFVFKRPTTLCQFVCI